jgi:basic amino acid/polyamine antiporter, APA family
MENVRLKPDTTSRRLGTWSATAMVVSQVVGVGIFLTPATMMRTVGSVGAAIAIWIVMGLLSTAGALCYAELTTRFPRAGGGYVFLREAFGRRSAFVYGWMALLVMDPGVTAALGIGFAQYFLVSIGGPASLVPAVAVAAIVLFGALSVVGLVANARVMAWTAGAKLGIVAVLVVAALLRAVGTDVRLETATMPTTPALAASFIAAFFAFGGWWEFGRMAEEVASPRRTMPLALVGGIALVTTIYTLASLAYMLAVSGPMPPDDQSFVSMVGVNLFGATGGRLLAIMVVVAVSGSLAATLLGAPRLYVAMARDGLFPSQLARMNAVRGSVPASTFVQVALASLLVALGTFNDILGYFVPCAVLFLGLSATAILVLPRPRESDEVFAAPWHPLPIVLFLGLILALLALFVLGQPRQSLLGAFVVALGIPASWLVMPRRSG